MIKKDTILFFRTLINYLECERLSSISQWCLKNLTLSCQNVHNISNLSAMVVPWVTSHLEKLSAFKQRIKQNYFLLYDSSCKPSSLVGNTINLGRELNLTPCIINKEYIYSILKDTFKMFAVKTGKKVKSHKIIPLCRGNFLIVGWQRDIPSPGGMNKPWKQLKLVFL